MGGRAPARPGFVAHQQALHERGVLQDPRLRRARLAEPDDLPAQREARSPRVLELSMPGRFARVGQPRIDAGQELTEDEIGRASCRERV